MDPLYGVIGADGNFVYPQSGGQGSPQTGNGIFGHRGSTSSSASNGGGMGSRSRPLQISVESTAEWKIHEILYNGNERYLEPLVFSDHVAKLAHKVNWRELIGDETTRDEPETSFSDTKGEESDAKRLKGEEGEAKSSSGREDVGPWDGVAKKLHQSLTEINVLLDLVKMSQQGRYLTLDPVHQTQYEESARQGLPLDAERRQAALISKRKSLAYASGVLERLASRLEYQPDKKSAEQSAIEKYHSELLRMRSRWRMKKVGKFIIGDLGYRPSASRWRSDSTFEVKRKPEIGESGECLEVEIPRNLDRKLTFRVYLMLDDTNETESLESLLGMNDDASNSSASSSNESDNSIEQWEKALRSAQSTLITLDIFQQIAKEAAGLENRNSLVQNETITTSLGQGFLVKICLGSDEFSQKEDANCVRIRYLETALKRLYFDTLKSDLYVFPKVTSLPLCHNTAGQMPMDAGPRALPASAKEARKKLLLENFLEHASHFILVKRTQKLLSQFSNESNDPKMTFHWIKSTPVWSSIRGLVTTPGYESFGRSSFMVQIGCKHLTLYNREGTAREITHSPNQLTDFLRIECRHHQIWSLQHLFRNSQWNALHSSPNTTNPEGLLVPSVLASNHSGSRAICVRLPLRDDPAIFVQSLVQKYNSDILTSDHWKSLRGPFTEMKFHSLVGTSLLNKLEFLMSTLS